MSDDNQTDNDFIIECLKDVSKPYIYILEDVDQDLFDKLDKIDSDKVVCINPKDNIYKSKYVTKNDVETKCLLYALIDGSKLSSNVVVIDTSGVMTPEDVKDLWNILGLSMVAFKDGENIVIYD